MEPCIVLLPLGQRLRGIEVLDHALDGETLHDNLVPVPGAAELDALNAFLLTGGREDEAQVLDVW